MRVPFVVFLVASLSGCGKAGPALAGGKPVDHWVKALKDPDPKVRKTAAFKLGNVGPADPAAFPALFRAIKDPDSRVRCEVILALVKFGPEAGEAVPTLTDMRRRDEDARVRAYAGKAVDKIQGDQAK